MSVILFNKPYGVLSQFVDSDNRPTLKRYIHHSGFYPAGRLDKDSEGLLVLTNDGKMQSKLSDPKYNKKKVYWAQVEGVPTKEAIEQLEKGLLLKDGWTKPSIAKVIVPPNVWARTPPVRFRKTVPDTWVSLTISEGRNRQVRRMLAHIGYPCLRLIRIKVDRYSLGDLLPGDFILLP